METGGEERDEAQSYGLQMPERRRTGQMRHGAWVKNGATGKHGERRMDCIAWRDGAMQIRTGNEATGRGYGLQMPDGTAEQGSAIGVTGQWLKNGNEAGGTGAGAHGARRSAWRCMAALMQGRDCLRAWRSLLAGIQEIACGHGGDCWRAWRRLLGQWRRRD
jgi:hypothetical protein